MIRNKPSGRMLLTLGLWLICAAASNAQTLARPGWAGSGVSIEPWWKRAVFYRIDPTNFQDSDGDGTGDLAGITQRLGYLQSLGVDAIVLHLPQTSIPPEIQSTFEPLARAAAEHKLRVLVELQPADASYLNAARFWLNQGAAGLVLDSAALASAGDEDAAKQLRALHDLLHGFPGGRILVASAAPIGDTALAKALAQDAQLIAAKPLATATNASALRTELDTALGMEPVVTTHSTARSRTREHEPEPTNFLWSAVRVEPSDNVALERTMAVLMLASRAAVLIDSGEEIGQRADTAMQWTPRNITPRPPAPIERRAAAATSTTAQIPAKSKQPSNVYGPYVPYVPPAKPKPPEADTPVKIDPNTLPGFTSGSLPQAPPPDATTVNVAIEEADPHSLLSFYRKLIQLHHGNASIHDGAETVLNQDDLNALVWLRRPPSGATTAATVIAICNLSSKPLDLSPADELKQRGGMLHSLVGEGVVSGGRVSLAPGAVWLGELRR